MSIFKTETIIPISVTDLSPVAHELAEHFKQRSYQVECTQTPEGQWLVGITRGGVFKAVVGLKSALKVQLEARPQGTMVRAGAGIFGKQAVPTAITLLVAWPVIFTQVWGLIREAELDNEAVRVVEVSLTRAQRLAGSPAGNHAVVTEFSKQAQPVPNAPPVVSEASAAAASAGRGAPPFVAAFCTGCGTRLEASSQFCTTCSRPRAS